VAPAAADPEAGLGEAAATQVNGTARGQAQHHGNVSWESESKEQ
jgi:hypothetical protein